MIADADLTPPRADETRPQPQGQFSLPGQAKEHCAHPVPSAAALLRRLRLIAGARGQPEGHHRRPES